MLQQETEKENFNNWRGSDDGIKPAYGRRESLTAKARGREGTQRKS
jgi:hypothetical protein